MTKSILLHRSLRSRALLLLILLLFLWPAGLKAQEALDSPPAHALTLRDCIALALQESPAIEANRFDIASATEDTRAEKAKYLPELTGTGSFDIFSGSRASKFSVVNFGPTPSNVALNSAKTINLGTTEVYEARLRYPLFRDGSILGLNNSPGVAIKQAKKKSLAWTSQLKRQEVIDRITDAFITTVSAQNRAGYAERRVKLLDLLVGITQEQKEQGLSLAIDLKVARSQLHGAQALAKVLQQQAVAGSIELARAIGMDSPANLQLEKTFPEPPEPPSAEQLLGSSLNQHPSLQVQRALIDQAKQEYRLERFRLYPSVSLDGTAVYADDFGSSSAAIYIGALTVSVPIFDFGAQLATTRAKLLKYKAERARLLSVADDVTFAVVKIYQDIYSLSQNILSLQGEVSKAERDFQVLGAQQQQGITPPLTSIEKELHLISKREDLDTLEARRLLLYSALQKAAGGAWQWIQ